MAHKSFADRLKELIDDELLFPGNPIAAYEIVISDLEQRLVLERKELDAFKKEVESK